MTFEAENQFYYALICFSLGVVSRAVGYLAQTPFLLIKSKVLSAIGYFFACFCALIIFIFAKNYYRLPSLRGYMVALFLAGFALLSKICDKKIAFLFAKLYNKFELKLREFSKNDYRKTKKGGGVGNCGGSFAVGNFNSGNGLSAGRYKIKRKRNKRNQSGNRAVRATKRTARG